MAKTKAQKQQILMNLKEMIGKSKSIIFTKFNGLGVKENEEIRKELKNEKNEYYAVKKTLIDLALKDKNIAGLDLKNKEGQVAAIFGYDDEISPARIINKYITNGSGKIDFLGGILENKFISAEEVSNLAKLPSKQELYAKMVGSIKSPLRGLVNALSGNFRNLVYVLKAIAESKK